MRLHEWAFATDSWRAPARPGGRRAQRRLRGRRGGRRRASAPTSWAATCSARGDGAWDREWRGWWGEDPPYHAPVFVLTHHAREPLAMEGGTTFHFVTDGIESALEQARAAAGDDDVSIAGGASAVRQYLAAGLLDELYLHIVPVVLGAGERLLEGVGDPTLEPVKVVASPAVTHVQVPRRALTERAGFEPANEVYPRYSLSRRVPSATRPPLPGKGGV